MKIVLASNNAGKLAELQTLFAPLGMTLVRQSELNIPEAAEPFKTFVENALAKARHAAQLSGLPALADDAGLCVDAFGGQPGVDTAYYATRFGYPKGDDTNVQALLEQTGGNSAPLLRQAGVAVDEGVEGFLDVAIGGVDRLARGDGLPGLRSHRRLRQRRTPG